MKKALLCLAAAVLMPMVAQAQFINEFQSNPPGADPGTQTIELRGTPLDAFTDWALVSVENDGLNGLVDRAFTFSGAFDANGIFTVDVPDLENPSFTYILTDGFSGTAGVTDIDLADDGTLDLSTFGTIFDAIGVGDSPGDIGVNYAPTLGGQVFSTDDEPELIFRDGAGTLFAVGTLTIDSIVDVAGNTFTSADFTSDPLAPTFGALNPNLIPEPTSAALLLGGLALAALRRRI